ncbi:MAG: stage V sporulation protein AD [Eubacteriales bacterium]|nr:stage V sporulation protein AD [Eubacteriales bacterium]
MGKRIGRYTVSFSQKIKVVSFASVGGKKEAEGPLGQEFDKIFYDPMAGQKTWEQAESAFQREAVSIALSKGNIRAEDLDFAFAGDLLNQCISSSFALESFPFPYLGQYGACSTMAQCLLMGAITLESTVGRNCLCVTSSNFCSAERQYRFPLLYGGQRTPTAQWTVSGAGSVVLSSEFTGKAPVVTAATVGRIVDLGVTDANNMGAAMAPAAAQTIKDFFDDTKESVDSFDAVFTGDLGQVGSQLLYELLEKEGLSLRNNHIDCGLLIYDSKKQDVHAGGSGCGCAATVLCSHILPRLKSGVYNRVLFVATGALLSPTSGMQGNSIPSVAHLVELCAE